ALLCQHCQVAVRLCLPTVLPFPWEGATAGPKRLVVEAGWKWLAFESCDQVARRDLGHLAACAGAGAGDVWHHNAVGQRDKWMIGRQWLRICYIQCSIGDLARLQRLHQGIGLHDWATCSVNKHGAWLHLGEALAIHQMMGLWGERC